MRFASSFAPTPVSNLDMSPSCGGNWAATSPESRTVHVDGDRVVGLPVGLEDGALVGDVVGMFEVGFGVGAFVGASVRQTASPTS
mmetsp:Transcript_13288/g.19838  ORF Transcript_13288/g.19838 Transcript_13288/m.19838 type:complete len:85 (+) Transcript_13288:95-349(+)